MGELHLAVNWECLNEGNGITSTLTSHFALWHRSCRDAFNRTKLERIIKRKMPEESHGQSSSKKLVLADLITEIQNSRYGQPHTTIFKLSGLRKEYCKRLIREGLAEETQEIHSTRLKEKLSLD